MDAQTRVGWKFTVRRAAVLLMLVLVALSGVLGERPAPAAAQTPSTTSLSYQGQVFNNGARFTATCSFQFALYDAATGGNAVGTTQTVDNVSVQDSYFSLQLDFGASPFGGGARYLDLAVKCPPETSFTPMTSRIPLTAVPTALSAPWSGLTGVPANLTFLSSPTACTSGQVAKWNGTTWACGDAAAGGGTTSGWGLKGNAGTDLTTFLGTTDAVSMTFKVNNQTALRLAPGGTSGTDTDTPNVIGGSSRNSVAKGVQGATIGGGGSNISDWGNTVTANFGTVGGGESNTASAQYGTVSGGHRNTASGISSATVGGGTDNTASRDSATVGGGFRNTASGGIATVSGGEHNTASENGAMVGGGWVNTASGSAATVGGGVGNTASGYGATVGGGDDNIASGKWATASGGYTNTVSGERATVGGGSGNKAIGYGATVSGGITNTVSGRFANVGGGYFNTASGYNATVGGGVNNTASSNVATVSGGSGNTATNIAAVVSGGERNTASGGHATVGGGWLNTASFDYTTVSGGSFNKSSSWAATVGGGERNLSSGKWATASGGYTNTVSGERATVGGGSGNKAIAYGATVSGGITNTVSGRFANVGGGGKNTASGESATVGGGVSNTANGDVATVGGGVWNFASGNFATVGGGSSNTASGMYATVGGGSDNYATGRGATIPGGTGASAPLYGQLAYASSMAYTGSDFAGIGGSAQTSVYVLRKLTTDSSLTELYLDGGFNTNPYQRLTLASGRTYAFSILVAAETSGGSQGAGYKIEGVIKNAGGTMSFIGTPTTTVLGEDNSSWDVQVAADDTNKALVIKAIGAASTTIRWVATVRTTEVGY